MMILGDIGYLKNIRNTIRFNIARLSEDMYSHDKGTIFIFVQNLFSIFEKTAAKFVKKLCYYTKKF